MKLIDLTGQTFGRLTVIKRSDQTKESGEALWLCQCSCPNKTFVTVTGNHLRSGTTSSCGCLRREMPRPWTKLPRNNRSFRTPEEIDISTRLDGMRKRCYNPNWKRFGDWGGRGITICDEWMEPKIGRDRFIKWSLANGFRPELTIDRIDNDGPYAPWNCRWISKRDQANNKSNNCKVEIDGVMHNLSEWAELMELNYGYLLRLYHSNFPGLIDAITSSPRYEQDK